MLPHPLISAEDIAARVAALGGEIATALPPGPVHVVAVLRGAFVFAADLIRALPREIRCDFLAVRSYGSATETSGGVEITHDLALPIAGQHVLLVEDNRLLRRVTASALARLEVDEAELRDLGAAASAPPSKKRK